MLYAQAYENEYSIRIVDSVAQELIAAGHTFYDAEGRSKEHPFVVQSTRNRQMTLGQTLWYLRNDERIRNVVLTRRLNVDHIYLTASELQKLRNRAAHGELLDSAAGARARELLLVSPSALIALFPTD